MAGCGVGFEEFDLFDLYREIERTELRTRELRTELEPNSNFEPLKGQRKLDWEGKLGPEQRDTDHYTRDREKSEPRPISILQLGKPLGGTARWNRGRSCARHPETPKQRCCVHSVCMCPV